MGKSPPSRLRQVLAKAALVSVSVLLVLVLAEVALRVVVPPRKDFRVWPAKMSQVLHPDPVSMPGHEKETHFTTSSLGLRGPEMGDDSEIRVLAVGGSTTECLYIDDASAWALRLAKVLEPRAGGRKVWTGSSGLSGLNSADHVLHAKFLLPQLPRMDVVVLLSGVNDLAVALATPDVYRPVPADITAEGAEVMLRRAFQQVPGRLESSWDYDGAFYRRLSLFQLVRKLKQARARQAQAAVAGNDDQGKIMDRWRAHRKGASELIDELPDLSGALDTYRKNLTTFIELTQARGARVVLITQPTLWRADLNEKEKSVIWMGGKGDFMKHEGLPYYTPGALAKGMKMFNDAMLGVCKERGVECFDLEARVPKDLTFFYDDCHFGTSGSEKMSDLIGEALLKGKPFAP